MHLCTVNGTHKYHFSATFLLKMGPTVLFTHLKFILLFSLFLLLFMGLTALFGTIYGFHCIISTNFYLYLQYFQQNFSSFSKINESQMDLKYLPSSQKRPNKKRESNLDLSIEPLILKLYIVRK